MSSGGQAFVGTLRRTFQQAVVHLLATGYGLVGSPRVLELLAADVTALAEQFYPAPERLANGWLVFTGTRASGAKAHPGRSASEHELVTLAWPVLLPEDIAELAHSAKCDAEWRQTWCQKRLVRMVEYGCDQAEGPVLLTLADLAGMLGLTTPQVSQLLAAARARTGKALPTKGYYFDQGMRPTHKAEIIALYEAGLDEAEIARQAAHAPGSVGVYIRDYERVKELLRQHSSPAQIAFLLSLQPNVVAAYAELVQQYHPESAPTESAPTQT